MGKRLIIRCFYTNFPSKFGILNHKRFCNNYFIRIIGGVIEPDLVIPHPAMQQYFPSVTCSKFYLYSHIYTLPINPKSRICGSQLKIYNRNFGYLQKRRIFSHQTIFLNSFFLSYELANRRYHSSHCTQRERFQTEKGFPAGRSRTLFHCFSIIYLVINNTFFGFLFFRIYTE